MKNMLLYVFIVSAIALGCSHTMSTEADRPESYQKGSLSTSIRNTDAKSKERRPSRYEICMAKLRGAKNAAATCEERMDAYKSKNPFFGHPYYGHPYFPTDKE